MDSLTLWRIVMAAFALARRFPEMSGYGANDALLNMLIFFVIVGRDAIVRTEGG